ncbi:MAG: tetratricopeptide repeat protein [Spirochaetota bacterium]|nr:tetratricopeptide repeat protein [Spirochaetota bacterium]
MQFTKTPNRNMHLQFILLYLLVSIFCQCSSFDKPGKRLSDTYKVNNREINSDWALYSKGLFYESMKDYNKAIKYYIDASNHGVALERIYYHLAKCYYYTFDYKSAIKYSKMSIESDMYYTEPYILLHGIYLSLKDYQEAASIYEKLIELKPNYVKTYYSLAILYYERIQNHDKALAFFQKILELNMPVDDYFLEYSNYYIGCIYHDRGDEKNAIKHFKLVLEINPDNYPTAYILANIMMDTYSLEEAKKYAYYYLKMDKDNLRLNSLLGRIYYLENNPKSIEYLRKGMSMKTIHGFIAKSLYLEKLHKDIEAKEYLKSIINKSPLIISPHIALARISLRNKDQKNAISEYFTAAILMYKVKLLYSARNVLLKILSINDKIPEIYYYIGKTYEEIDKLNLAIIYYKRANELRQSVEMMIHIGYLYNLTNNFKESVRYFDVAINLEPKNSKTYFYKGLAYSRNNNYNQAELLFKKAIELQSENDMYHFYLATVLEKLHRLDESIDSLKTAIKYNPQNARACNYLGYLYADQNKNLDESIDLIQTALKIEPLNGAYLDSLGWAYYRKGDYQLALEKLLEAEQQLINNGTPDPVVYDHIGDTYQKIGDMKKAFEYWNKSFDIENNPKIKEKIKGYRQ